MNFYRTTRTYGYVGALLLAGALLSSCVRYRDLVNFNEANLPDDLPAAIANFEPVEIQPNDLLRITVHSFDLAAAQPFNIEPAGGLMQGNGMINPQTLELFTGYFVDESGVIDFPVLGTIEVGGLTLEELKAKLRGRLEEYLKEPVVNVRFVNFKVSVLGSVARPGAVLVTNPRATILDVLGQVGDLTDYADRSDVLVIREENGERTYAHLDLHTDEIFTSEFFYVQQNDVIYAQPIRARTGVVADRGRQILPYVSTIASLAAIVVTIILNNNSD